MNFPALWDEGSTSFAETISIGLEAKPTKRLTIFL